MIKNPYGFIYITTNKVNNMKYIGKRKFDNYGGHSKWCNYLGSGKLLKKDIKKYGSYNFYKDILMIAYNESELNLMEIDTIKKYNAKNDDNYYNLADGGDGGRTHIRTPEIELKRRNKIIKKVRCITTDIIFDSILEATKFYDVPLGGISRCCNGIYKYSGTFNGVKLSWEFYN